MKGVGECGVIPAAAAIISAVEDALKPFNVRIEETPLCPGTILSRIDASQARNGMLQPTRVTVFSPAALAEVVNRHDGLLRQDYKSIKQQADNAKNGDAS